MTRTLETQLVYAETITEPPKTVEEVITESAIKHDVDPSMALAVAKCESNLDPKALGDNGKSRGIWQIHAPSWPEVSDEMAFNPVLSTQWAMPKLKETPEIWTCYRMLFD